MMKNILLPTDFSENSWRVIQYALELFQNEKCVFYLLNTYTPSLPKGRFMSSELWAGTCGSGDPQKNSKKGLKSMLGYIGETFDNENHSFRTISSFNLLIDEIKDMTENHQIDLIVIASHGVSDSERVTMGSNAEKIVRTIDSIPVLMVPKGKEFLASISSLAKTPGVIK